MNKTPKIKVQLWLPNDLYNQLKQSTITGDVNDTLATKIRTLINNNA